MKRIAVPDLKPGMKLAQDVYTENDKLLLLAGFIIKPCIIRKLKAFRIQHVFIDENASTAIDESYEDRIYAEAFHTMKDVLLSARQGKNVDMVAVKHTVNEIVHRIINNESVFLQLTGIRDIDNYTFLHSVDVCIYSILTGKSLGLSIEELTELGIGSILHDVGKCKVPIEILMKPGKLNEEEFHIMKLHTLYGMEIINNTQGLSKRVANVACQHHEKWNGSGYPLKIQGYDIDKYARIVAIADVYDALTADRVYKKRDMPHEAAEYLMAFSSQLFDPDILLTFLRNIAIYPEDTIVLLNDGRIGRVIETRKAVSIRPKVCIFADKQGPPVLEPYIIDLTKKLTVSIVDILS